MPLVDFLVILVICSSHDKNPIRNQIFGSSQIAFQQENAEVGEGIDVITIPDVPAGELNATLNTVQLTLIP